MDKITENEVEFGFNGVGYEFRIKKFTTEQEWNLCAKVEDILWFKYDCDLMDLDYSGFVVFNVWTRRIDPTEFRKIIVDEINVLLNNKK